MPIVFTVCGVGVASFFVGEAFHRQALPSGSFDNRQDVAHDVRLLHPRGRLAQAEARRHGSAGDLRSVDEDGDTAGGGRLALDHAMGKMATARAVHIDPPRRTRDRQPLGPEDVESEFVEGPSPLGPTSDRADDPAQRRKSTRRHSWRLQPVLHRRDEPEHGKSEPSPVTVGIPAILIKKLRGTPILFWVQDLWPESLSATGATESKWILRRVESLVRRIYRHCDKILVQSEAFRGPIERLGVKREDIVYLPNSAEAFYRPVSLEGDASEHAELPKGFRVMFGGNIGKAQGFEMILDAAELLKGQTDIHWIIVGDGRMFSWVRHEVRKRELGRTVHLLGRFPAEEMPRYFALADALLVTLRNQPIFSLTIPAKVQSYLACGKPIIAALDGEGARVVQEAGAGLTVRPEDARALADAVLAMYRMPQEDRMAMGLKGRSYFETHFERGLLLERLDRWMKELKGTPAECVS